MGCISSAAQVLSYALTLPLVDHSCQTGDVEGFSLAGCDTGKCVPLDRWDIDAVDVRGFTEDARLRVRYGSFLVYKKFDNIMFRISPAEATSLEPQQRMLLETGYDAFHRGGFGRSSLFDSDTGTFTGMMNMDAESKLPTVPGPYDMTGISYSAAGARISYVFAMRGPCVVFDTACSSSLVALHVGRRCIQQSECPTALVSGPNSILVMFPWHSGPALIGMLSARGRCHTFDARADGYLRGEGCGAMLVG